MPTDAKVNHHLIEKIAFTIYFVASTLALLHVLFALWPDSARTNQIFNLFGQEHTFFQEQQILLLVLVGGGIGSMIHVIRSFSVHMANRNFSTSWSIWYLYRPFQGIIMALILYVVLRGGFLGFNLPNQVVHFSQQKTNAKLESLKESNEIEDSTVKIIQKELKADSAASEIKEEDIKAERSSPINPYGILAIAFLAGFFSEIVAKRLASTFETFFNSGTTTKDKPNPPSNTSPVVPDKPQVTTDNNTSASKPINPLQTELNDDLGENAQEHS
ncbi:MAG: hypothetical protein SGJ04_08080 [Bacteroidota bacterium]|nr:hypothetical protein [Bacteroidota bacterium]